MKKNYCIILVIKLGHNMKEEKTEIVKTSCKGLAYLIKKNLEETVYNKPEFTLIINETL